MEIVNRAAALAGAASPIVLATVLTACGSSSHSISSAAHSAPAASGATAHGSPSQGSAGTANCTFLLSGLGGSAYIDAKGTTTAKCGAAQSKLNADLKPDGVIAARVNSAPSGKPLCSKKGSDGVTMSVYAASTPGMLVTAICAAM